MTTDWQSVLAVAVLASAFFFWCFVSATPRAEWRARGRRRELNESLVNRRIRGAK